MSHHVITTPGAVPDMPEEIYHGDPCPEPSLSSTMAKTITKPGGPARLKHELTNPPVFKKAFDFGAAAHTKALGRGSEYVIWPDQFLTPGGTLSESAKIKDKRAAWEYQARKAGRIPLLPNQVEQVAAMAEQLLANPFAAELLTRGHGVPELSIFDIDERTGRWLRGRLDLRIDETMVVDYKTTSKSAAPDAWDREAWQYGYHVQAAHYLAIAAHLGIVTPDAEQWFIVQESFPPYLVAVHRMDTELLADGYALVRRAITLWDRALTTGEWPGYPQTVNTISRPRWADAITEEDED